MPTESHKSRKNWTAEERLLAEQAVLLHRQVMHAMQNAPFGQGLAVTEAAVLARIIHRGERGARRDLVNKE